MSEALQFSTMIQATLVPLLAGGVFGLIKLSVNVERLSVSQEHLRGDLEIFRAELRTIKEEVKT